MRFPFFTKDFCLWIVPTNDGTVKKFRLTGLKIAVALSLIGLFSLTAIVVAGDYSRVQMLRAKSYLSLKRLSMEKESLEKRRLSLESEIQETRGINEKVLNYQQGVSQRVAALKDVLESATALGVIDPEEFAKVGVYNSQDGVGGAEIDCRPGEQGCELPQLQSKSTIASLLGEQLSSEDERDLQIVLDGYLNLIESIPFGLPANGYLSSGWGMRHSPFTGGLKMHQGLDFSVGAGDYVRSAADGIVKSVKRNSTYGLVVDVSHGKGNVVTRYAHLSKALVEPGEKVCRGEALALIGSTGRSTGPHLHFEVRINNKAHNPIKFFALGKRLSSAF